MQKRLPLILFSILALHLLILSQLQFTAWPEMLSFPYLINHGFITYKDMVHAYPPLLVNILAVLFKNFGYNVWVLKIFAWSSFLTNDVLIFLIIKKITKKNILSLISLLSYVLLQPVLEGNMIWPDLILVTPILFATYFLINKKYLLTGIFIGLAFLTKQTALLYVLVASLYIVITEKNFKKVSAYIIGGSIVGIPFLFNLLSQNSLIDFLNWTIIYPSKYWTKFPGYVQLSPTLRENAILLILFLPLALLIFKSSKKKFADKNFILFFVFLLCGIVGVYPRFSFFHFQGALVFIIIIYSFLISFSQFRIQYYPIFFILVVITVLIFSRNITLGGVRFWSTSDISLAQKIHKNSPSNQPIYLLGLNSNLYALSDRLPNSPWLDNFGWYLEIPGIQEEVIKNFKINPPSTIFWRTPDPGNWYDLGTYQPTKITDWIKTNYNIEAQVDPGIWEWTRK